MTEEEQDLYECLSRRYHSDAKTFVMTREETRMVMDLLRKKKRIVEGAEIASKYIKQYLT